MSNSDWMALGSLVIAFLSLGIAILSVVYARKASISAEQSALEARKSNEITRSVKIKDIYDAFQKLEKHMITQAEKAERSEVQKFLTFSVDAKLYLDQALAEKISQYLQVCFSIARRNNPFSGLTEKLIEENRLDLESERRLASEIENELSELIRSANRS